MEGLVILLERAWKESGCCERAAEVVLPDLRRVAGMVRGAPSDTGGIDRTIGGRDIGGVPLMIGKVDQKLKSHRSCSRVSSK